MILDLGVFKNKGKYIGDVFFETGVYRDILGQKTKWKSFLLRVGEDISIEDRTHIRELKHFMWKDRFTYAFPCMHKSDIKIGFIELLKFGFECEQKKMDLNMAKIISEVKF